MTAHRLAVWGDPIAHSKSPVLHAAAYRVLGLDWEYGRRQVDAAGFAAAMEELDETWHGLSVTMPLKEQAYQVAETHDRHAELTGVVNTLLLGDKIIGFNTDVGGIIDALAESGVRLVTSARILGAGATAASALVAASEIGARNVDVRARRAERANGLRELGERLGITVTVSALSDSVAPVDVTIATLPSGTVLDEAVSAPIIASAGALLDAAYAPWPSALAAGWAGGPVVSGMEMLLNQAIRQVRVFVNGDPLQSIPDEAVMREEMRVALI